MRVINLASGSDGNLTYIESDRRKVLVDDGLSARETVKRLDMIGISPTEIDGIIISHEHSDHIKGVDIFSSKFDVPVYAHSGVWLGLEHKLNKVSSKNRKVFDSQFEIDDLVFEPFEVPHDVKCFGFGVNQGNTKISILTDLGHIDNNILSSIKGSRLVYLEANYDKNMLINGTKYPLALKLRIDGPNGHLCNHESSKVVSYLTYFETRQIVLAHLSRENNTPTLAYNTICHDIEKDGIIEGRDIKIDVATTEIGTMFRLK